MPETGVDEWMPLHMGWWMKATLDWDTAWMGPVQLVLMKMWQDGFKTPESPESEMRLSKAARVSLRTWKAIRKAVGGFFTVRDGILTQEFLEGKYTEAVGRSVRFRTRNSENAKSGWEKRRQKVQWRATGTANGDVNGDVNGYANGIPNGKPIATPMAGDRASSSLDLDLDLKGGEGSNATAVPIDARDPRVAAVLTAYPTVRWIDGEAVPVKIGVRAAGDIAEFMNRHPRYPLLWVVKWYGEREKRPVDLRKFLEDPPGYAMWKNSWNRDPESMAWRLNGSVQDVLAMAGGQG